MLNTLGQLHPLAVQFPLALLPTGSVFLLFSRLASSGRTRARLRSAASWTLGFGVLSLGPALLTGWAAYQTVAHDAQSHAAMTLHRNWGLATAIAFLVMAFLAWRARKAGWSRVWPFICTLVAGLALLIGTGYRGGELVFRFGLGVRSLPIHDKEQQGPHEPQANSEDWLRLKTIPKPQRHEDIPHKH